MLTHTVFAALLLPISLVNAKPSAEYFEQGKHADVRSRPSDAKPAFKFDCIGSLCDKAQNAMELINKEFTDILDVNEIIAVEVDFKENFDHGLGEDEHYVSIAFGPGTHIFTDSDGVDRTYPQSLVRQNPDRPYADDMNPVDIFVKLKSDANWVFEQKQTELKDKEYDFRSYLTISLLTALGIRTLWKLKGYETLMPLELYTLVGDTFTFDDYLNSEYDRYVHVKGKPLSEYRLKMSELAQDIRKPVKGVSEFAEFLKASKAYELGVELTNLAREENGLSVTDDNNKVLHYLDSLQPFPIEFFNMNHVKGTSNEILTFGKMKPIEKIVNKDSKL